MADFYTATDAIEARLAAAWTATPAERLRFENAAYIDMTDLAAFCQVEISGGAETAYMGTTSNRLRTANGVVMLHLMAPILDGRTAIRAMHANADAALSHASWVYRDTVWIYMGGIAQSGGRPSSEDGSYFGVSAVIPFRAIYLTTP